MNLKIQTEKYLITMEWEYYGDSELQIIKTFKENKIKELIPSCNLYKGINKNTFVIMYTTNSFSEIQNLIESEIFENFINSISRYMNSDIHQSIYGLVNTVLPRKDFVPQSKYMQLRSIEVPLSKIDKYLDWREKTIYKFVKKNEKVKSFLAFHSIFSSNPGVLFVTEFDGDPTKYRNSFLTPEYKEIIKEAGHDHIKGGLNTYEYELC